MFYKHQLTPVSYTHLDVYKRQGVDTLEKFIMVVDECLDLERDLQRVSNQLNNYSRGDQQEPTTQIRGEIMNV